MTQPPTSGHSARTIDSAPFVAAYAKRADDQDDNAVRVFIFASAPGNAGETKSACDRAAPIPAFAMKSDKRAVEVDFNDASDLKKDIDVTFLRHSEGSNYMHNAATSPTAELTGSAPASRFT